MIDVVIPVYNGEKFIEHAVRSVLRQTLKPNKIIIINDGSTDKTAYSIEKIQKEFPDTVTIITQSNQGLSAARNAGILDSKAGFIAFLDADDMWEENKLQEQMNVFEKHGSDKLGLVYCAYKEINEEGRTLSTSPLSIDTEMKGCVFDRLLQKNMILSSGSGVLIKKECFNAAGLFDENLKACEDWDMWLRIAQHYEFDYSDKTLVLIRRHTENMQKDYIHMLKNHIVFYNKWVNTIHSNKIPKTWKNDLLLIAFLNRSSWAQACGTIEEHLSYQALTTLFGTGVSVKRELRKFLITKFFSLLSSPKKIVKWIGRLFK